MSDYKGTIIVPCYNKAHCVKRCLDSIVAQSRFNEFEIFVVDDCSTDDTFEIINSYGKRYQNIKCERLKEGSGSPSKPRNIGMDLATSPYVIFMDPDDKIVNDGYSVLLSQMERYESDILIGTRIGVTNKGLKVFTDFIDKRFHPVNENNDFIRKVLLNKPPFILKTIYNRAFLEKHSIRFNEAMKTSEDEIFDMTCVAYAQRITKIDDIVYQYTSESENSITTRVDLELYKELYDIICGLSNAYKLSFSNGVIAERIVKLVKDFYINRTSFMDDVEMRHKAFELTREALDKYGFENFSCLANMEYIRFIQNMKDRNYGPCIEECLMKRIQVLGKRLSSAEKQLAKSKKNLKKANKKLSRKIVKPAVKLADYISDIKKREVKSASQKDEQKPLEFFPNYDTYKSQFDEFVSNYNSESNGYWIFMDRNDTAKDNGEALYRYVMKNNVHDKIAFILSRDSIDYLRLKNEGFNVIDFGSVDHWKLLAGAEYFFTSHCDDYLRNPWYYTGPRDKQKKVEKEKSIVPRYKMVFLQHGVMRSNNSSWLGNMSFDKFIASAYPERDALLSIPNYHLTEEIITLTGLPRWDNLRKGESERIVSIFPTWRKDIYYGDERSLEKRFKESEFAANWEALLARISKSELSSDYKFRVILHHDNDILLPYIKELVPDNIELLPYAKIESWTDIINESSMLITDYSSLSFDYLYLEKPVIFFDFEKNAIYNNVAGVDYGCLGYYCPQIEDVMNTLSKIISSDCVLPEDKKKNIEEFFVPRCGEHSKRVIDIISKE